jgi:hypothetical protein
MISRVNDSAVLLAGDLAWPIVVLIVSITVLATQRAPLGELLGRIKSLKYPGGEAQLGVPEAGADDLQTLVRSLSRNVIEATEREETAGPGTDADETVQNREPLASAAAVAIDKVTDNVVTLATEVAHQLAELAYPPPPDGVDSLSGTIDTLLGRGVLDRPTADSLRRVVDIADQAARGAMVPARVATAVENSGPAILNQLATLQTVAAAQFEDHVLDELQERAPREWSIDIDRAMPSGNQPDEETSGASAAMKSRHARVDALVSDDHQEAVVEVRARLQPTKPGQIEAVRTWMKALPSDVPVLLIMLGRGLSARQLREISEGHTGPVELLEWDRNSDELIKVLRGLLRAQAPERPEVLV